MDPVQARRLLHDAALCPANLRDFAWHRLDRACAARERFVIKDSADSITSVALSSDGSVLVRSTSLGAIDVYDGRTGTHRFNVPLAADRNRCFRIESGRQDARLLRRWIPAYLFAGRQGANQGMERTRNGYYGTRLERRWTHTRVRGKRRVH